MTPETQTRMLVRSLRGAPWTVIIAMIMLPDLHGEAEIAASTGYTRKTVRAALIDLEALGFVERNGRYEAWILTARARQLVLGETLGAPEPEALEAEALEAKATPLNNDARGKNYPSKGEKYPSHCSSSTCSSTAVNNHEQQLRQQSPEGKKLPLDLQEPVDLLCDHGVGEKRARDAVEAAAVHGWDGQQCMACITGWLAYAETDAGSTVKHPGFLAAARLKSRRNAPTVEPRKMTTQDYIQAAYDRLVKS